MSESKTQRKVTTKEYRIFRQCMDELERRDSIDLEELLERANQKRKKEK